MHPVVEEETFPSRGRLCLWWEGRWIQSVCRIWKHVFMCHCPHFVPWHIQGFPWWLRCQRICLQCRRSRFDPWVRKIPWRREWKIIQHEFQLISTWQFHMEKSLPRCQKEGSGKNSLNFRKLVMQSRRYYCFINSLHLCTVSIISVKTQTARLGGRTVLSQNKFKVKIIKFLSVESRQIETERKNTRMSLRILWCDSLSRFKVEILPRSPLDAQFSPIGLWS